MTEVCPLLATSLKYSVFLSIRLLFVAFTNVGILTGKQLAFLLIFGNGSCSLWVARKKDLMRPQELREEYGGKSGDCIQKGPSVLREMVAH